jgi:hypothetical protein
MDKPRIAGDTPATTESLEIPGDTPATTESPEVPDKITLTIDFFPATQECEVRGPVDNRGVCYSMLKLAEKAIDERYAEIKKRALIPVHGNGADLISHLRNRG